MLKSNKSGGDYLFLNHALFKQISPNIFMGQIITIEKVPNYRTIENSILQLQNNLIGGLLTPRESTAQIMKIIDSEWKFDLDEKMNLREICNKFKLKQEDPDE